MKRLVPFLAVLLFTSSSFAQYDPTALGILDAMSAKFKEMESFKAPGCRMTSVNSARMYDATFESRLRTTLSTHR